MMVEIIVMLIFLFFAVIGASCITYRVWLFIIRPKEKNKAVMVTKLDKNYSKDQFMYYFEKYRWCGKEYADTVIMVYDGEQDSTISAFCKAHRNIICCREKELGLLLHYALEE